MRGRRFTKDQLHIIKQSLIDADIMGLGKFETIAYVKSRLGSDNDFSEHSYNKYRNQVLNDETNINWISYYARQGFVEFYRKRISEMEMIQKETFKQWLVETNRADSNKDKRLILSLVAELRANNQHLASLGMVTPIIATIKNIMDKEKIGNASTIVNPIQYQVSRESTDTSRPETTPDQQYSGTTTTAAERDINRKF